MAGDPAADRDLRGDVVEVDVGDDVAEELAGAADRRVGEHDQLHVARQEVGEALLGLAGTGLPEAVLVVERAEVRRFDKIDAEAGIEHGLRGGGRHDRALAAEAAHHVQQIVHRHMPACAAGVGRKVAGVPSRVGRESVGERVRVRVRERRAGNTGGLEQILRDVVSIGGDGDVVPKLILERRGEYGVGWDGAVHDRKQDSAEAEVHVLIGIHAEVGGRNPGAATCAFMMG